MDRAKRKKLEAAGWRVGSAAEFLELSPAEAALVDVRVRLGRALRSTRTALGLSQDALARRLKSSQSRVAKMEAGDATVTVDLILSGLFEVGATTRDVAQALQAGTAVRSRRGA
jgi:ribosome-binding protein aMBF1 (putative translation factor)